jgi:DNA polymerase V
MDFVPEDQYQMSLFENANPKHKQLMKAIDLINHTIGSDKIKLAGQDLQKTWKMKQEKLSPRYTTKLNEIIDIKS